MSAVEPTCYVHSPEGAKASDGSQAVESFDGGGHQQIGGGKGDHQVANPVCVGPEINVIKTGSAYDLASTTLRQFQHVLVLGFDYSIPQLVEGKLRPRLLQ